MGAAATIELAEVKKLPQYQIYKKNNGEITAEPEQLTVPFAGDPYLQYGGAYLGDPKDTPDFKYVTWTAYPKFSVHGSLMRKHLTEELFEQLKNEKTNKGYTLSNTIHTGVVNTHLGVGMTAGDEDAYNVFKPLIYPIIKGWHGYDAYTQKHPTDLDPSKLVFTEAQREKFAQYVVSTRIRAARNISGFSLPPGATADERAGVEKVLKETFANLEGELKGTYYELGSLTKEQTDFLHGRGFLFQLPGPSSLLTGAGASRSWPNNRGIFHNDTHTALAWVNEEDHCRIISMELEGNIPSVFTRFCKLSTAIKASAEKNGAKLMWNETLGFLGTCPSNLGTGLRASVMIKLEAFNKLIETKTDPYLLDYVCAGYELQPRGSNGEFSAAIGSKFDVSNKQRIGFSEVDLVQKMINGVDKVIDLERRLTAGESHLKIREELGFTSDVSIKPGH